MRRIRKRRVPSKANSKRERIRKNERIPLCREHLSVHFMNMTSESSRSTVHADWKTVIAAYQEPNRWRASFQILNTVFAYAALWYLMYLSLSVSWWVTALLAVLAGGFLIRTFIIFHDCGHGSFFRSRRANDFWGFVTGLLTWTPYYQWRWEHSIHHASTGHLERRGVGDIWTLTVKEYLESSRWKKFSYRIVRNPFFLFVVAPLVVFVIWQRFPAPKAKRREVQSVWIMNLALLIQSALLIWAFGWFAWLIIQAIVLAVAGSAGVWLFYVQHQFEDAYWERGDDWDYAEAALLGSSFYKLPKVLQWFSGNIGFHHIHHLSSRIPNYNLERCHRSNPMFEQVVPLTFWGSFKTLSYRLWDENARKLISFGKLRRQRRDEAEGDAVDLTEEVNGSSDRSKQGC